MPRRLRYSKILSLRKEKSLTVRNCTMKMIMQRKISSETDRAELGINEGISANIVLFNLLKYSLDT